MTYDLCTLIIIITLLLLLLVDTNTPPQCSQYSRLYGYRGTQVLLGEELDRVDVLQRLLSHQGKSTFALTLVLYRCVSVHYVFDTCGHVHVRVRTTDWSEGPGSKVDMVL